MGYRHIASTAVAVSSPIGRKGEKRAMCMFVCTYITYNIHSQRQVPPKSRLFPD